MRLVSTAFLALLFGVGFAAFFVVHSVLGYLSDADAFVATAREADARTAIVDAIETDTLAKLAEDPQLDAVERAGFRALLERTITDEWLETSLRSTHAAAMAALDESDKGAVIELEPTKRALSDSVADLAQNAQESCDSLFGAAACVDRAKAEELIIAFQRNLDESIGEIPDSLDLVELMTGDRKAPPEVQEEMRRVRQTLGWARAARLAALGLLGLCLLVIALLNASSLARAMRAVGASVLVGVLFYLVVAYGYVSVASEKLDDAYAQTRGDATDEVEIIALEASNRAVAAAVRSSAHRATWPVAGIGGAGLLLLVGGVMLSRRTR